MSTRSSKAKKNGEAPVPPPAASKKRGIKDRSAQQDASMTAAPADEDEGSAQKKKLKVTQDSSSSSSSSTTKGSDAAAALVAEEVKAESSSSTSTAAAGASGADSSPQDAPILVGHPTYLADASDPSYPSGVLCCVEDAAGAHGLKTMDDVRNYFQQMHAFLPLGHPVVWLGMVATLPCAGNAKPWLNGTGGRLDAYFALHSSDPPTSDPMVWKNRFGVRWLSDIYANGGKKIRPKWFVAKYKC